MIMFKKLVIFIALTSVIAHANINKQHSVNAVIQTAQQNISHISMDSLFDLYIKKLSFQQKLELRCLLLTKVLSDTKVLDNEEIRGCLIDIMDEICYGDFPNSPYREQSSILTEKAQLLLCREKLTQKHIDKIVKIFTQLVDFYKKTPILVVK